MSDLTVDLLVRAMTSRTWESPDVDPADAERFLPHLVAACKRFKIDNKARLSAFIAQTGHESGSWRWMREFAGTGSVHGDYFGRGPIQLTHRDNYRLCGQAIGRDLVGNPDLVASDPAVGFAAAAWFWRNGNGDLNAFADVATSEGFDQITRRINGGLNGKADRDARYARAREVLPDDLQIGGDEVQLQDSEGTGRKILTVSEETRLYKFIRYIEPAVGQADYWTWKGGFIPDGPGAYAFNGPVPDISVVIQEGLFCAAVPTLALRCDGKRVPFRPNFPDPKFDGGIAAYFSGYYGAGYFTGYDDPFDLATAKRWAKETRSGVLLGKGYWGVALGNQGHTGILLPSGYVLQSSPAGGLNWDSHVDWERQYWENGGVMAHPSQWIEYDDPDDVPEWARQAGTPSPGRCVGH